MKIKSVNNDLALVNKIVNNILSIQRLGVDTVFEDILNLYISTFSFGHIPDLYFEVFNRYKPKEFETLQQIFSEIIFHYTYNVSNKVDYDLLGEIYQNLSSSSTKSGLGQFFTPLHVTHLMAMMTVNFDPNVFVLSQEPACGSGRNCISAFNRHSNLIFNAIDLDRICVKVSIVNFHLYNMIGSEVIHGNAISTESFGGFRLSVENPLVEKMFSEKAWSELSPEVKNNLLEFAKNKTSVILPIDQKDIIKNQSIYFHKIRQNVEKFNRIHELFEIMKKDFTEESFETDLLKNNSPHPEKIIMEVEEVKTINVPDTTLKLEFDFKKTKKFQNQISLFD